MAPPEEPVQRVTRESKNAPDAVGLDDCFAGLLRYVVFRAGTIAQRDAMERQVDLHGRDSYEMIRAREIRIIPEARSIVRSEAAHPIHRRFGIHRLHLLAGVCIDDGPAAKTSACVNPIYGPVALH